MDNTFNIFYAKNKQLIDKHYSNFNVQRNKYILGFVAAFVALTIIFLIFLFPAIFTAIENGFIQKKEAVDEQPQN